MGYKTKYDYVEIMVDQQGDHWVLTLKDRRHGDSVVHDEQFASAEEAQDAALAIAQHHINVAHNDTLAHATNLVWKTV